MMPGHKLTAWRGEAGASREVSWPQLGLGCSEAQPSADTFLCC